MENEKKYTTVKLKFYNELFERRFKMSTPHRRLSLFLVMILIIVLAEKKAVAFEVKAGQVKGSGLFVGTSLKIKKQHAFIVAFFDGIRKITEDIAEKKGKLTVIQKDNIITTNSHEKIGDFEVYSKTEVKMADDEKTGELISDHIEINYMAQKYVIQNFVLTSPPTESVKFIKWNNPPKTISGIKIHGVNWVDKTAEVIISYPEGTKLAETKKPSSKTQSSDKSLEATNSVPTKDSEDNENGWKNLKWGTTLKEVLRFDEDIRYINIWGQEEECTHLDETTSSIYFEREKSLNYYYDVSELYCVPYGGGYRHYTGILFYKGKFFGKIVTLNNYKDDNKTQNIIITQLKEKYPNGKISYYYVIDDDEKETWFGTTYKTYKYVLIV